MKAKKILLVASGANKADAVAAMVNGPVDPACPASVLQNHEDVVVGSLSCNGQGRGGGNRTSQDLQAPVLQGVISVHALLSVMLVILELPLKGHRCRWRR